jgi:hypothetical protein
MNKPGHLMRVVLAFLLLPLTAAAQSANTADLYVTLRDPSGAAVNNATVTVRDEARSFERSTSAGADGEYRLLQLPPGVYTLTIEAPGFGRLISRDLRLTVGQLATQSFVLQLPTVAEELVVSSAADLVETQRTSATTTIQQQSIQNLPINGRNYINFTLTNSQAARDTAPSIGAAPTSGLNIGGQRARSNLVNVDGADAVDNSVNGIRSTVSQEAVQEFQIITNSYAAEYGRASGGVINIISRSGSNDLHGNAFIYGRHRSFQSDNPFSTVENPPYTRIQTGLTLGGPIKRDRTFFFFAYETTRRQETGFTTIGADNFGLVNVDISRFFGAPAGSIIVLGTPQQRGFLENPATPVNVGTATYAALVGRSSGAAVNGAWPAALGGAAAFATTGAPLPPSFHALNTLRGNYPVSEGTSVWSLRLDHQLADNQQWMARVSVSPSTVTGIQVNAQNQNFGQNAWSRTSEQTFRDVNIITQHSWTVSYNKVNELRFQFARRGLRYDFSRAPGGGDVAINIPGFAFFGREPFSFVDRVEKRFQFTDNFSWVRGNHNVKFGADFNYLPLTADFTVNFGALYNFGAISSAALGLPGMPAFSPVQAYGLGIPQTFVQGIGDPRAQFSNKTLGLFIQDSWRIRPNLTLNYGVRYDVEFTPVFDAVTDVSRAAESALNIVQGIPRDTNNFAPRIGLAWDPFSKGKTVIRAAYGIFFDHPLLALAFNSHVADHSQAPQLVFGGGAPSAVCSPLNLNATNLFQGIFNPTCLPGNFGYLPQQQRFDAFAQNSVFTQQRFLDTGLPLIILPFGFPVHKDFVYAYANQANFTFEHDLGHDFALSLSYNFNGGRKLHRPIDINPADSELLLRNWQRALAAGAITPDVLPIQVATCGVGPLGPFVPAPLMNFFRPSGLNPTLTGVFAACMPLANAILAETGFGLGVPIPFSFPVAQFSNGSSVYHGLTTNLRKRFGSKYEFLASYTWSKAIDDSTDLQSLLSPQDSRFPGAERSLSTFDQRHRFVFSGVYQTGRLGGGGAAARIFSHFTIAPIIEVSSGRPFNILVGSDRNFDFSSNTDRPLIVPAGTPTNFCGDTPVASSFSPTGFLQPACWLNGTLTGNLGRNAGRRPYTVFTDLRIARRFHITERIGLDGIMDVFNFINRFNVADVNPLWNQAGTPTAAFDPRQFQFALKLNW